MGQHSHKWCSLIHKWGNTATNGVASSTNGATQPQMMQPPPPMGQHTRAFLMVSSLSSSMFCSDRSPSNAGSSIYLYTPHERVSEGGREGKEREEGGREGRREGGREEEGKETEGGKEGGRRKKREGGRGGKEREGGRR